MPSGKAESRAPRPGRSSIVLFDDGRGMLSPLTDLRPAFAVRTGAFSLLERLNRAGQDVSGVFVPPRLAALTAEMVDVPVNDPAAMAHPAAAAGEGEGGVLVLNARCVIPPDGLASLAPGQAIADAASGDILAARLPRRQDAFESLAAGSWPVFDVIVEHAPAEDGGLLSRPWHVRTFRDRALAFDLQLAPAHHQFTPPPPPADFTAFGAQPLYVHPTARLCPACILDLEHGPIWIDAGAVIRPGATIIGPAYIGPHSTIIDHALIKAHTSIGPHCKVGGEVGGCIFQGCANKAHEGHLGDSWVGQWANLGAGTTNSNLLNTYGEVIAYPAPGGRGGAGAGGAERTGQQFLGAIIGDHARLAICTRIMTGAIIGTGVMWAATAPITGHIPPFAWVTDAGQRTYRLEKFLDVARTVMARRGTALTRACEDTLRAIAESSNHPR